MVGACARALNIKALLVVLGQRVGRAHAGFKTSCGAWSLVDRRFNGRLLLLDV